MTSPRPIPGLGARIRQLRRAQGIKQSHLAHLAGVCQTTVSRWEAGVIQPDQLTAEHVLALLTPAAFNASALCRLVETSCLPVHLIRDSDHCLLAASASRVKSWGTSASRLTGQSLWGFATPDIAEAEQALTEHGWWQLEYPEPYRFHTRKGRDPRLSIAASTILWERLWLADGTPLRLCTTLAYDSPAPTR